MDAKFFPALEKLITQTLQLATQLQQQLQRETAVLNQFNQPETLTEIALQKRQLVEDIESNYRILGQFLTQQQLPNNQNGLLTCLRRAETNGMAIAVSLENWQQLKLVASECQALNEQNGAAIDLLSRQTQRSLDILKGKPQTTDLYGPGGAARSISSTPRTLASV